MYFVTASRSASSRPAAPAASSSSSPPQVPRDPAGEEQVGRGDLVPRVVLAPVPPPNQREPLADVVGALGRQHELERLAVGRRRPHLEPLVLAVHPARVDRQPLEVLFEVLVARRPRRVAERGQEHLERRQTLLAVHDVARVHLPPERRQLAQHHGPQEVGPGLVAAPAVVVVDPVGRLAHVVPQRRPLLLLLPHVGPLEHGEHVAALFLKQLEDAQLAGFHPAQKGGGGRQDTPRLRVRTVPAPYARPRPQAPSPMPRPTTPPRPPRPRRADRALRPRGPSRTRVGVRAPIWTDHAGAGHPPGPPRVGRDLRGAHGPDGRGRRRCRGGQRVWEEPLRPPRRRPQPLVGLRPRAPGHRRPRLRRGRPRAPRVPAAPSGTAGDAGAGVRADARPGLLGDGRPERDLRPGQQGTRGRPPPPRCRPPRSTVPVPSGTASSPTAPSGSRKAPSPQRYPRANGPTTWASTPRPR